MINRLFALSTIGCVLAAAAMADVLTLRNGQTVHGTYIGGTARQIQMEIGGQIQTFDISQIQSVSFTDSSPQGSYNPAPQGAPGQSGPQSAVYNPNQQGVAYNGGSGY